MPRHIQISTGQHTDAGLKAINQDFHGLRTAGPTEDKGIVAAIADGISSSAVSHIAAELAVKSFVTDFYATPDAWSTKRCGERVFQATNAWLHGQTQAGQGRFNKDQGYVCTLSVLVLRWQSAHLFHAGDTRIYRLEGHSLEQLTTDHRLAIAPDESYLSRALGMQPSIDVEYRKLSINVGDVFILTTDGVHDFWSPADVCERIAVCHDDLNAAARQIIDMARDAGSPDNLSIQIIRIDAMPDASVAEAHDPPHRLAPIRELRPGQVLDEYLILRELHASHRSHVFLAKDRVDGAELVIKIPATEAQSDPQALERLLNEEWVARRVNNPHLLKAHPARHPRSGLYVALEHVKGQNLRQWLLDNPRPSLEVVRSFAEQIGLGLQALHRMEMVHQDIRPDNVMLDEHGTLKIIDFGSTLSGVELDRHQEQQAAAVPLGTEQFSAPEMWLGQTATAQSDVFSLAVLIYYMLCGQLPYGAQVNRLRRPEDLHRLKYRSLAQHQVVVPIWVEAALRKALHPQAHRRHAAVSELVWDLRHPNPDFQGLKPTPLAMKNPVLFWQIVAAALLGLLILSALGGPCLRNPSQNARTQLMSRSPGS
jgi:serine/threonine protein kinase